MGNKSKGLLLLGFVYLFSFKGSSQYDSIQVAGIQRSFIVHLPPDYSSKRKYPLVLNLHGLNSNAYEQLLYSQFNLISDTAPCIVVYPDAIDGKWDFTTNTDLEFIATLVDTLKSRYTIDQNLFSTGMSMGAFMTYKIACNLKYKINAIAPVAGNMTSFLQNFNCNTQIPVLHIHGTEDPIVSYEGALGIPPVETTLKNWSSKNGCSGRIDSFAIPDINKKDSSFITVYQYKNCQHSNEVLLYKVYGGGHTWPGAPINLPFGNTNRDIHASTVIWDFFKKHIQSASTPIQVNYTSNDFTLYPNPVSSILHITYNTNQACDQVEIFDVFGRKLLERKSQPESINISSLNSGMYFLRIETNQSKYKIIRFQKQ